MFFTRYTQAHLLLDATKQDMSYKLFIVAVLIVSKWRSSSDVFWPLGKTTGLGLPDRHCVCKCVFWKSTSAWLFIRPFAVNYTHTSVHMIWVLCVSAWWPIIIIIITDYVWKENGIAMLFVSEMVSVLPCGKTKQFFWSEVGFGDFGMFDFYGSFIGRNLDNGDDKYNI